MHPVVTGMLIHLSKSGESSLNGSEHSRIDYKLDDSFAKINNPVGAIISSDIKGEREFTSLQIAIFLGFTISCVIIYVRKRLRGRKIVEKSRA